MKKMMVLTSAAVAAIVVAGVVPATATFAMYFIDSPIDICDGSIHAAVMDNNVWSKVKKAQIYKASSTNSDSIDLEGFTHSSGPSAPTTASPTGGWLLSGMGGWVITISNSDRPAGPKGAAGNKKNKDSISVCSIDPSATSCGQPTPGDGHEVLIATDKTKHNGKWEEVKTGGMLNLLNFHDVSGNCKDNTGECNYVELIKITSANAVAGANGDTYNCTVPENCHIYIRSNQ